MGGIFKILYIAKWPRFGCCNTLQRFTNFIIVLLVFELRYIGPFGVENTMKLTVHFFIS